MKITTEIEWYETDMVPGADECAVLCAFEDEDGEHVIGGRWSSHHDRFFAPPFSEWRPIDPIRWAYMPDFPRER